MEYFLGNLFLHMLLFLSECCLASQLIVLHACLIQLMQQILVFIGMGIYCIVKQRGIVHGDE